jgi:hypothetical protein
MFSLGNWTKAAGDVTFSLDGLGDFVRALADWVHYQPSPQIVGVPTLATKLAALAGLNESLASAMVSDGPANTNWMLQSLENIRKKNQEIIGMVDNIDPNFGSTHSDIVEKLSASINEKVRLLDTQGNGIDLSKAQDRKDFGRVLRTETGILQQLATDIEAARAQSH